MTHERLLELVWQVDIALAMSCGAFVLYEAVSKSASSTELKSKLDLKRSQLLSSAILEIEETLRPYWSARASRIIIEPEFREETPTVLSDDAKNALTNCLDESDCLRKAVKMRGMAMKVSRWDRIDAPPLHSRRCSAVELPASVGVHVDCRPRADVQCPCASDTSAPHAA